MNINHDKIEEIIRDVAADKIIPRYNQLQTGDIRSKTSPTDLVTIADEEAEIELTRILKDLMPGSEVVGEEAVSSGKASRDILGTSDNPIWLVDPVDGTHNFAHGKPVFGTMVALIYKQEKIASWIYQIPRERIIAAEKGGGVTIDRVPFTPPQKIADDTPFEEIYAFVSWKFAPPPMRPILQEKYKQLKSSTTCTCCAWEYIDLLEGKKAFSIYGRIEPWDHMAGALILEEAGFHTRKWDGSIYKGDDIKGGVLNATSPKMWERIHQTFLDDALKELQPQV